MIHLKKEDDEKVKNNFSILYTCLSIIILTFFIFLTVNSTPSQEKKKIAIGSLIGSFGLLKTSLNPVNYGKKNLGYNLINIGKNKNIASAIQKIIERAKYEKYVFIKSYNGRLLLQTKGNVAFIKGTDRFTQSYYILLNRIYNYLSAIPSLKIEIIAYPDNNFSKDFISKWDLAAHRAYKVVSFFKKRGVNLNNIVAYGKGVVQKDGKKIEIFFSGRNRIFKKNVVENISIQGIQIKVK